MKQHFLLTVIFSLFTCLYTTAQQQPLTQDSYCLKLNPATTESYYVFRGPDSVSVHIEKEFKQQLNTWGQVLSRFDEHPLRNTQKEIFRAVTFNAFSKLDRMVIYTLEKRAQDVEITLKFIERLKDSTMVVAKKTYDLDVWDKFLAVATPHFLEQPAVKKSSVAVMDGSTTVFEGNIGGQYHFVTRYVMSMSDPELGKIENFLRSLAGSFFDPNCKKQFRQK